MIIKNIPIVFLFCLFSIFNESFAGSPYEIGWTKDGIIMGVAAVSGGTALLINGSVPPITEIDISKLNRASINAFDRSAAYNYSKSWMTVSDYILSFCTALPIILMLSRDIRKDAGKVGLMYLESWLFSAIAPYLAKGTVQRIRPFIYNPDVPLQTKLEWGSEARLSFFSGHSCVSFASAAFLSKVYQDYYPGSKWTPYIWTGALLSAGFTAFLRYESGVHFPTDILTGSIVGTVIGIVIPEIHRVREKEEDKFMIEGVHQQMNIGISIAL